MAAPVDGQATFSGSRVEQGSGVLALSRVLIPESWPANDTMKLIKAIVKVFAPVDTWSLPVSGEIKGLVTLRSHNTVDKC